jgi:transcriptional regulator with XRE-family HTH domain
MKPNALRAWRKKNEYSQAALAKVLGVDVITVSRWERGVSEIPPYLHITLKCLVKETGGK